MKKIFTISAFMLIFSSAMLFSQKTLTVVAAEWEGLTNADGSGLYLELFRMIYEKEGYEVKYKLLPWARVKAEGAKYGEIVLGESIYQTVNGFSYSKNAIDSDAITALVKKDFKYKDFSSFKGKTLAWMRAYNMNDQVLKLNENEFKYLEIDSLENGLKMLAAGRFDALIDYSFGLNTAAESLNFDLSKYRQLELAMDYFMAAFINNPKGNELMTVFDKRMKELKKTGALDALYKEHGYDAFSGTIQK